MRKVIVGAMISMDGVMQAPGAPEEDPTGGFTFGGWVAPLADGDPVFGAEIGKLFGEPFDLLLGRRTYEIFAAYWPYAEGGAYNDIATAFNRATKYVATRKGADLTWKGSVALRDGVRDVAKLKQEDGPPLVTQGSSELVHSLLAADLVDEIRTFTFPVLLGKGKRLYDDSSRLRAFTLTYSAISERDVELAIRASIGAGRGRLFRQLLTESVLLAFAGAVAGVLLAYASLDSLLAIIPLSLPPNSPATINSAVLAFALGLTVVTALLFGLVPALKLVSCTNDDQLDAVASRPRRCAAVQARGPVSHRRRGPSGTRSARR